MKPRTVFHTEEVPPLPDNLLTYQHQVGGHGSLAKTADFKMLRHDKEPIVYKKLPVDERGDREANFYLFVFAQEPRSDLAKLKSIIPAFHGLYRDHTTGDMFIGLEDALAGLENPSVCDLKMGRVPCPPDVDEKKFQHENSKFTYRDALGFIFTCMKVYDKANKHYLTVDRHYGRTLDCNTVFTNALVAFLQGDAKLARSFLTQIEAIRRVFAEEPRPKLGLYCSSLLLAYDEARRSVVVRLVDFAHWRDAPDADDPSGVVHGLDKLIDYLRGFEGCEGALEKAPFTVVA